MGKIAFIFPGQGVQTVGMGLDFYQKSPEAKAVFDRADQLLGYPLTEVIFEGPLEKLTKTHYSQVAIYVTSIAILEALKKQHPDLKPDVCAGLSLGEYTALTASGYLPFERCLPLVQLRSDAMSRACEATSGGMVAIIGLNEEAVTKWVESLSLPSDVWIANFNCPGQVVVSGTKKGMEAICKTAKERGAKRALPLQVHGAFHSGLMIGAQKELTKALEGVCLEKGSADLVMNVTGKKEEANIKTLLAEQVTSPVRWEQSIGAIGADLYVEIGPGKTLTGFNKRIKPKGETISFTQFNDFVLGECHECAK